MMDVQELMIEVAEGYDLLQQSLASAWSADGRARCWGDRAFEAVSAGLITEACAYVTQETMKALRSEVMIAPARFVSYN